VRVKSVTVRNYRSLRDVTVDLDGLTVLIGPNGSGKTSVLRALELFSGDAPPVTMRDFNDRGKGMCVDLVLSGDGADGSLAHHVVGGEIRLRREYAPGDPGKPDARLAPQNQISATLNSDFDGLRRMTKKTEIEPAIAALKKKEIYSGLPECESVAKGWTPLLLEYERNFCLEHPDHPSVRPGYVQWDTELLPPDRLLNIVYVPAMRDIAQDAASTSGSYLGKLINMAIDYARERDTAVGRAAMDSASAHKKYFEMVKDNLVPRLNDGLLQKSRRFAKDAGVAIELGKLDARLPSLSPSIVLSENGTGNGGAGGMDIEHVGGGLQRIYLMALLETIADQGGEDDGGGKGNAPSPRARLVMIDEPELYQHPQRQRAILHALGTRVGCKSRIQILCSTHSPYFIELSRIESLRLLTKDGDTDVHVATRQEIMGPILEAHNTALSDDDALNRWLDTNASHWITEGLFSRLAVIVEGIDDRNILLAAAAVLGIDLNEHEISIVPAHGKPKIFPVAHLFVPFGIPLYLVWDLDEGNDDGEENDRLLRLADPAFFEGHAGLRETTIEGRFSCFRTNLTTVLHGEIGAQKRALERAGGWSGLLGPHMPRLEAESHCETCACKRLEPSVAIRRALGSRDVAQDLLSRIRAVDAGAFDSLKPVQIVKRLVEAAGA